MVNHLQSIKKKRKKKPCFARHVVCVKSNAKLKEVKHEAFYVKCLRNKICFNRLKANFFYIFLDFENIIGRRGE